MLKDIIEFTVKSLVESPQSVVITENHQDSKSIFEIRVSEQDIGKVIGKEGQTIRALKMLLIAIAPEGKEIEITVAK